MNLSPYVKCVCPQCFKEIYLGDCRIIGKQSGMLKDTTTSLSARLSVESLTGSRYATEMAQRECTECHYLLPYNIELVKSIALAVVGDNFSGKTHYIVTLIRQIEEILLSRVDGFYGFTCLTPDIKADYDKKYSEPLLQRRQVAPATIPATDPPKPLIYEMEVSPSRHQRSTINLMLYDVSGEDLTSLDRLVRFGLFALNPTAFIFVVDPVTVPSIYSQLYPKLSGSLQAEIQRQFIAAGGRRPAERMTTILSVFKRFHRNAVARLSSIPVAIMVSKADLLRMLPLPYNYSFMQPPQYGSRLKLRDFDSVDKEVRRLLNDYGQGEFLKATRDLRKAKFFATSAMGDAFDASGNFTKDVEPFRCLDPFLWIMHELSVVKAV